MQVWANDAKENMGLSCFSILQQKTLPTGSATPFLAPNSDIWAKTERTITMSNIFFNYWDEPFP